GRAEAEVIRTKSLAEAEAIEKRAEALNQNKEVMMTEMLIKMLPEFAKAVSEPMSNVDSIRILDQGNGKGVNNLSNNVTNTMTSLQESLSQMTGIDLNEMLENISGKGNLKQELGQIASTLEKQKSQETQTKKDELNHEEQAAESKVDREEELRSLQDKEFSESDSTTEEDRE